MTTQKGAPMLEETGAGTLLTLKLPAQPEVKHSFLAPKPADVTLLALTKDGNELRALTKAVELLETLYSRGVTSPEVLAVLLEATGHREVVTALDVGSPQSANEGRSDHAG
jgi:hypothetical protein